MTSTAFWQGIAEFNQQEFYACHDTLEALWMDSSEPEKSFYQGILQIAVGCYHLENCNWRGAVILLGEGARRLQSYQPEYGGIDVTQLLTESLELLTFLHNLDPSQLPEVVQRSRETQEHQSASVDRSIYSLPKIIKSREQETENSRVC